MSNTRRLFEEFKDLTDSLHKAHEKSQEASEEANNYGGQWEQETATDLDGITVRIQELLDDLESIIEEAKTIRDDADALEKQKRDEVEDEEVEKESIEEVQDKITEKEWRRGQI